jgi:hypothetical protein
MDGPGLDKSALAARNDSVHLRAEPTGHSFGDDLRYRMNETYGSEISDGFRAILLREENNVSRIDDVKIGG